MKHTSVTVASLNIRGVPLTGSRLTARCQAIGAFFEAGDADVVCFQEVCTYYHLRQLARHMPSFRFAGFRAALPGPAGDVVTFSRLPMSATAYHGFGPSRRAPGIGPLIRLRARMKGALVTRLADPGISVVNTHPVANTDGDWSPSNRFSPVHRAQLAAVARVVRNIPVPAVVCGDFNVDRDSALFGEFIAGSGLDDTFEGGCPATFRAEYLPAGETPHCIDFILTAGGDQGRSRRGAVRGSADSARRNRIRLRSSRAARPAELPRRVTRLVLRAPAIACRASAPTCGSVAIYVPDPFSRASVLFAAGISQYLTQLDAAGGSASSVSSTNRTKARYCGYLVSRSLA